MFRQQIKQFVPYLLFIAFLSFLSVVVNIFLFNNEGASHNLDFQLFILGSTLLIGYYIHRIAPKTAVPSYVWAIFAGMALQPLLSFFREDLSSLKILMELMGALVLFSCGLETPFHNFKKWFLPVASLSLLGVIFSSLGFACVLYSLLVIFGTFDPSYIPSIIILGAALASADPTAIIPTLRSLHLRKGGLKEIAVAESELTDVSGSILTKFLLFALITTPLMHSSILSYFFPLLQKSTYDALSLQIISGILIGAVGYRIIRKFYYAKNADGTDPALFVAIPIFTFVLGNIIGGAGFLASYISGLLTEATGGMRKASRFYDNILHYLITPFVFIILGSLVPVSTLLSLAPIGFAIAFIFMFVIRPLVVCISLAPWIIKHQFTLQDVVFLSFIRETGIISAILIVMAATFDIIQSDFVLAIGLWVILLTLVLEPPLMPYVAKKIGVTEK